MTAIFRLGCSVVCYVIIIVAYSRITVDARNAAGNTSEQETACMTTCVDAYKQVTQQCCVQLDCAALPVSELVPYIGQCPADGLWLKWGEWSHCSTTCLGVRTRRRYCHFPAHLPQGRFCMGHGVEIDYCGTRTC